MFRIITGLKPGMAGSGVSDLQSVLQTCLTRNALLANDPVGRRDLSALLTREQIDNTYRDATAKLVSIFQQERHLHATAEVDEATASALNALLAQWGLLDQPQPSLTVQLISGSVRREDGLPVQGLTVRATHESDRGSVRLGQDNSDPGGGYTIRYEVPPDLLPLHVRVTAFGDSEQVLKVSELVREVNPTQVIDLVIPLEESLADQRLLQGRILLAHGAAAENVTLRLYRRDFGGVSTLLGQGTTLEGGHYALPYAAGDTPVSLEVRAVYAAGTEVTLSHPLDTLSGTALDTVNLVAPSEVQSLAPEYTRLVADLTLHVGEIEALAGAQQTAERQDLTVLNRATGWDARLIALAAQAQALSSDTDLTLPPTALYGLLRAGLPSEKTLLAQVSPDVVETALKKARDESIITMSDDVIGQLKTDFTHFALTTRLAMPVPGSQASVQDMLTLSGLSADAQKTFAPLYLDHSGDAGTLWDRAKAAGLDDAQVTTLQRQGKFAFLAGNGAAMTSHLLQKGLQDPAELAAQGYHHADQWKGDLLALAGVAPEQLGDLTDDACKKLEAVIPSGFTADTVEERLNAYTEDRARLLRQSYPTHVLQDLLETKTYELPAAHDSTVTLLKAAVAQEFRFGQTPVSTFLAEHGELKAAMGNDAEYGVAVQGLKDLQRAYQLSPSQDTVPVLLGLNLTSAHDVTASSEADFTSRFTDLYRQLYHRPVPDGLPHLVYRKAVQVSSVTYTLFTMAKQLDSGTPLPVTASPTSHQEARDGLIKQYPTLESLFGSMDYCECEHCRSVLSPAAYLVDLLQFVDAEPQVWANFLAQWKATHGGHEYPHTDAGGQPLKPYDVLIQRRPDLPYLSLTCENTQTALPYIDVVNEILEYSVAHGALGPSAAHDTGDATTPELLAEPQNVIREAYDLLGRARYPLDLPVDLWLETVRQFCTFYDVPLHQLLETFRPGDALIDLAQPYDRAAIFLESLGLSPGEVAVFTDPGPLTNDRWYELYGYSALRAEVSDPTNAANATVSVSNAEAETVKPGLLYTYLDVSAGTVNPDARTVVTVGAPESGGAGRTQLTFSGIWPVAPEAGDTLLCDVRGMLRSAKALSRRLGVSYQELTSVLRTGFVNPRLADLTLLYRLGISIQDARMYQQKRPLYEANKDLLGRSRDAMTPEEQLRLDTLSKALPGNPLTPWQVIGEIGALKARLTDWAAQSHTDVARLDAYLDALPFDRVAVLADQDAGGSFDLTTVQYADGTAADAGVFLRINLFVRLWRKLGWSVEDTDLALQTFIPRDAPFDTDPAHLSSRPLLTALISLAHFQTLEQRLLAGAGSRARLLSLWTDFSSRGASTLYGQLFLTRSVLKSDPVFDDPVGDYLSTFRVQRAQVPAADALDPALFADHPEVTVAYDAATLTQYLGVRGPLDNAARDALIAKVRDSALLASMVGQLQQLSTVAGHTLALQGALGLTAEEIAHILEDTGQVPDTAALTLSTLSSLYRYGFLARALKMTVTDLMTLKRLSGLNPFTPLVTSPLATIEEDAPFSQTLAFLDLVRDVQASGLSVASLDYLARHRFGPSGPYAPDPEKRLALLQTLADGSRTLREQQVIPADPTALTDEVLRQKLGLALPADIASTFLTMFVGSAEYTVTMGGVAAADKLDLKALAGESALRDFRYDATRKEQHLTYRGVLTAAEKQGLKDRLAARQPAVNSAVLDMLLDQVEQQAKKYFGDHLERNPAAAPPVTGFLEVADYDLVFTQPVSGATDTARRARLAQVFFPFLQDCLTQQFIVQTLGAQTGADPGLAENLLTDVRLLHTPNSAPLWRALALTSATDPGVQATYYASADATGPVMASMTAVTVDTALKPAGSNSAHFEGYLQVPTTGAYRFVIELDRKDARASLRIPNGARSVLVQGKAPNDAATLGDGPDDYTTLTAGALYRYQVDLRDLGGGDARVLVVGESLPRGLLSQLTLTLPAHLDAADQAVTLFSGAVTVVQAFGLSERELRYVLSHPDAFDQLNLSDLPTTVVGETDAESRAATLRFWRLHRLMGYAQLKRDLAVPGDALIDVFEDGASTDDDRLITRVYPRLAALTRRRTATVRACAEVLFSAPNFTDERPLRRLWAALELAERFGVAPDKVQHWGTIVGASVSAEQRFEIARDLRDSLKARYSEANWHNVAQPIFDRLRRYQRDALVSYLLHRQGFSREEELYEYFLIDPGMEPVVQTSRIRLATASLQLFIQRCLLNLEPSVHPSTIQADQWEWMKRYRVWEANRKIFLYPENWLEPEFRDDKSHLFTELEGALLQGDVSSDLVEDAFLTYLKKLDELARLDIVAMHLEDHPDPAHRTLHVFGRTYGLPHKYFYRRYVQEVWTPWEPVSAQVEGDHLAPVVWRGRLYLFWVTFLDKPQAPAKVEGQPLIDFTKFSLSQAAEQLKLLNPNKLVDVHLHWSEYLHGQWSTHESSGSAAGAVISSMVRAAFTPGQVFVHVTKSYDPADGAELGVTVHLGDPINQSIYLAGRNSVPEQQEYTAPPVNPFSSASSVAGNRYVGGGSLYVTYRETITTELGKEPVTHDTILPLLRNGGAYTLLPCDNQPLSMGVSEDAYRAASNPAAVEAALKDGLGEITTLMKPAFYQDNRFTFFIESEVTEKTVEQWTEWITPRPRPEPWWELLATASPFVATVPVKVKVPVFNFPLEIDPRSVFPLVSRRDWLVNPSTALRFGDALVGPRGHPELSVALQDMVTDRQQLSITAGSSLPQGTVAMLTNQLAFSQSGQGSRAGSLNIVGGAGLTQALRGPVSVWAAGDSALLSDGLLQH